MPAGVFYQTLEIYQRTAPFGPGFLPAFDDQLVRLSARAATVLGGEAIGGLVNRELTVLAPRIRASMPVIGGVLIGISIDEAETVDEQGKHEQSFVSAEILGVGRVPQLVLRIHQKHERGERAAPAGWTPRTIYLWATL